MNGKELRGFFFKVSQNDQIRMLTLFTNVFFINGKELRSFSLYQILT